MSDAEQQVESRRTESSCRLIEWKPWSFENPSLLGHCSIAFAGGWVVRRISVFRKASLSIGAPDAADVDRDGQIREKPDDKIFIRRLEWQTP